MIGDRRQGNVGRYGAPGTVSVDGSGAGIVIVLVLGARLGARKSAPVSRMRHL